MRVSTSSSNNLTTLATDQNGSRDKHPSGSSVRTIFKRYFDVAVVCVVIAVVWALLALPTVFYHLPQGSSSESLSDVCVPEMYNGSICREVLQTQQSCLTGRNDTDDVFIAADPASSQLAREGRATLFVGGLSRLSPSPECMRAVVPFLCLYIFPLCDNSNGLLYQPSSVQCREIIDGICANEFDTVQMRAGESQLPQCQSLPETTLECDVTIPGTQENQQDSVPLFGNDSVSITMCSEDFFLNESTGQCLPECGVWEELPHSTVVGIDVVVIFSAIVYLLSGVAVLVLSCINYKRMFSFPSIFIVYSVIAFGVLEVFILIGYIDRTSLFCSSRSLLESLADETTFCKLQGIMFYYAVLVLDLFWIFHIAILFGKIVFPFHAKRLEARGLFPYIHLNMIIAALALPWQSLGSSLGKGGLTIPQFPPVVCLARNTDVTFYSFILPISIINATGVSLITIIFWTIIKVSRGSGQIQKSISTAELKIFVVFFYFLVFSVVGLTAFTILISNITDFTSELTDYFVCEFLGTQSGRTCERGFNRMESGVALTLVYVILGFFPVVSLVYVVNYQETKEKLSKWWNSDGSSASSDLPGTGSPDKEKDMSSCV